MKLKVFVLSIFCCFCMLHAQAESSREKIEQGIQSVERLIDGHKWHEAFAKLREVEASAGNDALRYLTAKQRYVMYNRLNKPAETKDCMTRMETLAKRSGDVPTIEDMLMLKAQYNSRMGRSDVSKACYLEIFNRRITGKDDKGKDKCFKSTIEEAKKAGNKSMQTVISDLYATWQDSIAAVRAAEEIASLKTNCAKAQEEIVEKEGKISWQWRTIVMLLVLIIGVSVTLVVLFLMFLRSKSVTKKLHRSLDISETSSAQKSVFLRNIAEQISPSLQQIAAGNAKQHVEALEHLIGDVQTFMEIEETKEDTYESTDTNVGKLCEEVAKSFAGRRVEVTADAPMIQFRVNTDAVKQLTSALIEEMMSSNNTERIVFGFKKRNPHTGHFTLTVIGLKFDEEERKTMFIPFAKVYDLTQTTGMTLPICSLMAHKMNGSLTIDESFAKGTRFVLEIHS